MHTTSEKSGLEGTYEDSLDHPLTQLRALILLSRVLSSRVLNISSKGDASTSLGNVFQCLIVFRVKIFSCALPGSSECCSKGGDPINPPCPDQPFLDLQNP